MKKLRYILVLFLGMFAFGQNANAACPTLYSWEFPFWNNSSPTVKRVNTNWTENWTIFFCRATDITNSVTTIIFSETDLMNTQPGKAPGTDSIAFGSGAATYPIGTSSADLTSNAIIGSYTLKGLNQRSIPTQAMSTAWNQKILFHFYRRYQGNGCQTNRRIRNYLRNNAGRFRVNGTPAQTDTSCTACIAKLNDVILTHQTDTSKTIKADLKFVWSQNYFAHGCGGPVSGYNHFGVAALLTVKTNAAGAAYNIDQAGTYELPNVGVFTEN